MALPTNHTISEERFSTCTNSIASTPLACAFVMPMRGRISKIYAVVHGAFTTDCSVAIAGFSPPAAAGAAPGSGTALSGSPLVITAANSAAGTNATFTPTANTVFNEGDVITLTPSGSTGTTIGATFTVIIVPA